MRATHWEFKYRALLLGLIFGAGFMAYGLDHQNAAAALSAALGSALGADANLITRILYGVAAISVIAAALVRTWGSAYLHASVVYAAEVKTDALVADGPYRRVRNPLYFGNMLLVIGVAAFMSRTGCVFAVLIMLIFCYRLIGREESELQVRHGEPYARYRGAVPCLWPALRPRVAPAGGRPSWAHGFQTELWMWGYSLGAVVFAVTLSTKAFLAILAASFAIFWLTVSLLGSRAEGAG